MVAGGCWSLKYSSLKYKMHTLIKKICTCLKLKTSTILISKTYVRILLRRQQIACIRIRTKSIRIRVKLTFLLVWLGGSGWGGGAAGSPGIALVHPLLVDAGLLVALQVRAGLEPLGAVGAEVRPLARVRIQVLPQVGRLFEPVSTMDITHELKKRLWRKPFLNLHEFLGKYYWIYEGIELPYLCCGSALDC